MKNLSTLLYVGCIALMTSCASQKPSYSYNGNPDSLNQKRKHAPIQDDVYATDDSMPAAEEPAPVVVSSQQQGTYQQQAPMSATYSGQSQNYQNNQTSGTTNLFGNSVNNRGNYARSQSGLGYQTVGGNGGWSGTNLYQNSMPNQSDYSQQGGQYYDQSTPASTAPRQSIGGNTPQRSQRIVRKR